MRFGQLDLTGILSAAARAALLTAVAEIAVVRHVDGVADNGVGMPETYQPGKGLASMRKRATTINATIDIAHHLSDTGTQVRITLR